MDNLLKLPDLFLPRFLPIRTHPEGVGPWAGHIPFANDLIAALRPGLLVELGTHWGESYFTFCQSVAENGLPTMCYAVDHWQGEAHAGFYTDEVFHAVATYNQQFYKSFSYLLRKSFDEAISQFSNESIDLLHVDGLHTYEAVKHDVETWLPKVRPGGIILLHDIAGRHEDFGVWRLWEELKESHDEFFEFHHSWGLGVIRKAGGDTLQEPFLQLLFKDSRSHNVGEYLRRYYVLYASHIAGLLKAAGPPASIPETVIASPPPPEPVTPEVPAGDTLRVYPFCENGYSEDTVIARELSSNNWTTVVVDLPSEWQSGALRIDPIDRPGLVQIDSLCLQAQESGDLIWPTDASSNDELRWENVAAHFRHGSQLTLCSSSTDLQLYIPQQSHPESGAQLRMRLRIRTDEGYLDEAVALWSAAKERDFDDLRMEVRETQAELKLAQAERATLMADVRQLAAERNSLLLDRPVAEDPRLREELAREVQTRNQILNSFSWKVTAPARRFMETLRRLRG